MLAVCRPCPAFSDDVLTFAKKTPLSFTMSMTRELRSKLIKGGLYKGLYKGLL